MELFDGIAITSFESRQITSKRIINQIGSSCENKTRWAELLRLHHHVIFFESLQNFLLPKEKIQKKNQEKRAEIICYYFYYYQYCRLFCQKETLLILYLKYYAIKKKIYYHTIAFFSPPNLISIFINCSTSYYAVSIRYLLSFTLPLHIKIELF